MGVLDDKDVEGIAAQFGPLARAAVATAPDTPRAFPPGRVAGALRPYVATVLEYPGVPQALERAVEIASGDTVLVTGSLYTIGEAYRWLDGRKNGQ
jgi:dihydrofolate synthase/folylpolyglutamate synthase